LAAGTTGAVHEVYIWTGVLSEVATALLVVGSDTPEHATQPLITPLSNLIGAYPVAQVYPQIKLLLESTVHVWI